MTNEHTYTHTCTRRCTHIHTALTPHLLGNIKKMTHGRIVIIQNTYMQKIEPGRRGVVYSAEHCRK